MANARRSYLDIETYREIDAQIFDDNPVLAFSSTRSGSFGGGRGNGDESRMDSTDSRSASRCASRDIEASPDLNPNAVATSDSSYSYRVSGRVNSCNADGNHNDSAADNGGSGVGKRRSSAVKHSYESFARSANYIKDAYFRAAKLLQLHPTHEAPMVKSRSVLLGSGALSGENHTTRAPLRWDNVHGASVSTWSSVRTVMGESVVDWACWLACGANVLPRGPRSTWTMLNGLFLFLCMLDLLMIGFVMLGTWCVSDNATDCNVN
jgi:hypothetical protein